MITVYHYYGELTECHIITSKDCGKYLEDNDEGIYDLVESFKLDVGTGFNMAYDRDNAWQGDNNLIKRYDGRFETPERQKEIKEFGI